MDLLRALHQPGRPKARAAGGRTVAEAVALIPFAQIAAAAVDGAP